MTSSTEILRAAAEMIRPPRRVPVAQAVEESMIIYRPGGYSGPWSSAQTPYMVEPMNRLADRGVEAVVFIGPARTGKTAALIQGWLTYAVVCDPGDMLIVHMTADTARDFSRSDLERLHRHSPQLKSRLSPWWRDDNVFDKAYRHGMRLSIGWPAISQLSGKTLRYVALTDYDRWPDDIDGEGDGFTLARKRVQTFLSSGRVLVESSPGRLVMDAKWQQGDPHEGPPCGGIFALYNQGDRRRWYWPCPLCGEYFTAAPSVEALQEQDDTAHLICPRCGGLIPPKHKHGMNLAGAWVAHGQTIDRTGAITGTARASTVASYWLTGPAAAYQAWHSLLGKHQAAEAILDRTGNEETLQAVVTGDFGTAYRPRVLHVLRDPGALVARAEEWEKREVPPGVRYLTAAVDVQANRFVAQVLGWGAAGERWIVDRFALRWSTRQDLDGQPEPIDPSRYLEDWQQIVHRVVRRVYPLAWDDTRGLSPLLTVVDSGGKSGTTERAYHFWKQCRAMGLSRRVLLVKGGSRKDAPRIKETYPDSSKTTQRRANARGEVPVLLLNTLLLKDALAADLDRPEPGPGYVHLPAWAGGWFFNELTAETRTAKGWENLGGGRNEAFDLMVYNAAAMLHLGAERIDWAKPPAWADPELSHIRISQGQAAPTEEKPKQAPKPSSSFITRPTGRPWIRR